MYDTLIMAKKNNFDVFNALDLMEVWNYCSLFYFTLSIKLSSGLKIRPNKN